VERLDKLIGQETEIGDPMRRIIGKSAGRQAAPHAADSPSRMRRHLLLDFRLVTADPNHHQRIMILESSGGFWNVARSPDGSAAEEDCGFAPCAHRIETNRKEGGQSQ